MGRRLGSLDAVVAIALAAGLVGIAMLLRAEDVAGAVRVVDGDSLELAGRRIRLTGIDAPELGQACERRGAAYRCGEVARDALRELAGAGTASCRITGTDRYGRALAVCTVRDDDLGAALVRRGWAVSYGAYRTEESEARSRRLGLWEGTFEPPSEWRRRHPHGAREAGEVRPRTP